MRRKTLYFAILIAATLVVSGCSNGGAGGVSTGGHTGGGQGGDSAGGSNATGGSAAGGSGATAGAGGSVMPATGGTGGGAGAIGSGGTVTTGTGGTASGGTGGTMRGGGAGAGGSTTPTGGGGSGAPDAAKSAGCGKTPTITTGSARQVMVGGMARTYNIQIPAGYDSNKPYRLILGYHGASQSANTVTGESYFGLRTVAQDTILVAPQGIGNAWPNTGGADVTFSRQLVMELEDGLCIDTKRIFAEGFSMGGAMAYSMACSAADVVRAVAVHSGCPITACAQPHSAPVAYFMTHGTADQICAYPRYGVPLLQDFAKVNGCTTPDPRLDATAFDATLPKPTSDSSACIDFMGCKPGYPTRSCLFVGPHEWNPGRPTWVPAEVWSFFKQF